VAARTTTTEDAAVTAIVLALLASLGWGLSDFLGGLRSRSLPLRAVVAGMLCGGLLIATLVALVRGTGYPGNAILLPGIIAGCGSVIAISSLYKGLAIGSMSIVAPISAAYPVVPVVYGLLTGERPSALQFAGMALIFAGVIVASSVRGTAPGVTEPGDAATAGDAERGGVVIVPLPDVGEGIVGRVRRDASAHRPRTLASVGFGVVAAIASGVVLTALSSAADTDPYWGLIIMRAVALTIVLVVVAVGRSGFGVRPAQAPSLLAIGALDTVATGLFGVATTYGFLSVVSVIASLFPLGTIALARLILRERIEPHQNFGVAAALAGVAIVALG
jgi:drug/metabolite transporter (DMT)-like permease